MRNKNGKLIKTLMFIVLILSIAGVVCCTILKAGVSCERAPAFFGRICSVAEQHLYVAELLNNFGMAYIVSYIFYTIPMLSERRRKQSIGKSIRADLLTISRLLEEIWQVSEDFVNSGGRKLKNSPNVETVLDRSTGRYQYLTYKEHFVRFYRNFEEVYCNLKPYIAVIDDELRDCLSEILKSGFSSNIRDLLIAEDSDKGDSRFEQVFSIDTIAGLKSRLEGLLREGE